MVAKKTKKSAAKVAKAAPAPVKNAMCAGGCGCGCACTKARKIMKIAIVFVLGVIVGCAVCKMCCFKHKSKGMRGGQGFERSAEERAAWKEKKQERRQERRAAREAAQ